MRILLPVDESPYSEAALQSVIAQFQTRGAEVRVLCVVEEMEAYLTAGLVPELVSASDQIERSRREQSQALVKGMAERLRAAGFSATEAVDSGHAVSVILDHAEKWDADLIVMGSHGLKGLGRLLMGSVSDAVVRHAGCSVEVVRVRKAAKTAQS